MKRTNIKITKNGNTISNGFLTTEDAYDKIDQLIEQDEHNCDSEHRGFVNQSNYKVVTVN